MSRPVHLDLTHLGKEKIKERLPGIRQIAMDFANIDPVEETIVFGKIAGENAMKYARTSNFEAPDALENISELKTRYKNVYVRNKGAVFNQELVNTIELGGMLDIAEAICIGALARKESRGSHYRLDHHERDDANWLRHTVVTYTPEGPGIDHKPVNITMYEPKRREY